jgi:hypothetical protein
MAFTSELERYDLISGGYDVTSGSDDVISGYFWQLSVALTSLPLVMTSYQLYDVTSGRYSEAYELYVICGRYTTVLSRYDVITSVFLLSPTTSGQSRRRY